MSIRNAVFEQVDPSADTIRRSLKSYSFLVYVFLYAPIAIVVIFSFTSREIPAFPIPGFSLKWYGQLIPPSYDEAIIDALVRSVALGLVSAVLAGIFGTLTALGVVRNNFKILNTGVLNTLFMTPLIVPWIVTAIAVLTLYAYIDIAGTFISLVIGHVLITLPFVVTVVASQLYGFDRSLEEAAMNMGANELRTFYEITLPLISPGIIAGMLFAFTISFDNFTQTFFWTSQEYITLPIIIYGRLRFGLTPVINAIGTVIILFSMMLAMAAEILTSRYVD